MLKWHIRKLMVLAVVTAFPVALAPCSATSPGRGLNRGGETGAATRQASCSRRAGLDRGRRRVHRGDAHVRYEGPLCDRDHRCPRVPPRFDVRRAISRSRRGCRRERGVAGLRVRSRRPRAVRLGARDVRLRIGTDAGRPHRPPCLHPHDLQLRGLRPDGRPRRRRVVAHRRHGCDGYGRCALRPWRGSSTSPTCCW